MSNHVMGPCAELNSLGFWVPVVYFPHRSEVGNAKTDKGRAEEIARVIWDCAIAAWKRDAGITLCHNAPEHFVAKRAAARAALAKAGVS